MPSGIEAPTEQSLRASVLGVPVDIETNSNEVFELARSAYGVAAHPGNGARLSVRIVVDSALRGEAVEGPRVLLQDRDHLILGLGRGEAVADSMRGVASARVAPECVTAAWFRESVLDHLTLFLVTERDRCPLHAGAIVRDGRACLLAGPSGLGKSSLTYAAMLSGYQVLADDAVYVQREPSLRLWSLPRRLHLTEDSRRFFPQLSSVHPGLRPDGRRKISVAIPLSARAGVPWVGHVVLFILAEGDGGPDTERLAPEDALREMRSTLQGGFVRFANALEENVRAVAAGGCWRVRVSAEPGELVRRIDAILLGWRQES